MATKKQNTILLRFTGELQRVFEKETEDVYYLVAVDPIVLSALQWQELMSEEEITVTVTKESKD